MKKIILISMCLSPLLVICQTDNSNATKQETIDWIDSQLAKLRYSKDYGVLGGSIRYDIDANGSVINCIKTESYPYSPDKTTSQKFDLNNMAIITADSNGISFNCNGSNCIECNYENGKVIYDNGFRLELLEHINNYKVERLNKAFKHILMLNERNNNEKF